MSYFTFFNFTQGLTGPLQVPKGTKESIVAHIADVTETLGFEVERYNDVPRWKKFNRPNESVSDDTYCETVEEHNRFVQYLYEEFNEWSKNPVVDGETITPEEAVEFWYGLQTLPHPPVASWTREYYTARMDCLYEVMRGRECEGIVFDEKPLTERQAAKVVLLFAEFIDLWDMRLDVPKGCDYLASSCDGGYEWCEKCGAVTPEHADACRKRKCPLREVRED